jgi:ferric iron reductase protein FhuF
MIAVTPTLVPGIVPVENALAAVRRRRGPEGTRGLLPGLIVPDGAAAGWLPASTWTAGGARLDDLLDAAKQRWGASPHAAAALAWRSYTYWLAMPVVLGWATARRVLLLDPDDVLVRVSVTHDRPLLTLGLRRVRLAVLAGDPIAGDTVAGSEAELLRLLRTALRDHHLDPLLSQIRTRVNLGDRTLLGSLASAVAYGVVRGVDAPAAELIATAETLLTALDLPDLVDLEPGPDGVNVRRRTCCLAFTLPEPKICSGCCLKPT